MHFLKLLDPRNSRSCLLTCTRLVSILAEWVKAFREAAGQPHGPLLLPLQASSLLTHLEQQQPVSPVLGSLPLRWGVLTELGFPQPSHCSHLGNQTAHGSSGSLSLLFSKCFKRTTKKKQRHLFLKTISSDMPV